MADTDYATKREVFELDKRLTVAESDIGGIKEDIGEMKNDMKEQRRDSRNSLRANIATAVMVGVTVIGIVVQALT